MVTKCMFATSRQTRKNASWRTVLKVVVKLCEMIAFPAGILQENDGSDSQVNTLRWCLQKAEKEGMVDWTLGGHQAERPAQVYQGHQDDMSLGLWFWFLGFPVDFDFVVAFDSDAKVHCEAKGRCHYVLEAKCSAAEECESEQRCFLCFCKAPPRVTGPGMCRLDITYLEKLVWSCCCLCSLGLEAPSLHIRVHHRTGEAVVVLGEGLASWERWLSADRLDSWEAPEIRLGSHDFDLILAWAAGGFRFITKVNLKFLRQTQISKQFLVLKHSPTAIPVCDRTWWILMVDPEILG